MSEQCPPSEQGRKCEPLWREQVILLGVSRATVSELRHICFLMLDEVDELGDNGLEVGTWIVTIRNTAFSSADLRLATMALCRAATHSARANSVQKRSLKGPSLPW